MRIENEILRNLIRDEEFSRKVMPFLEPSYFGDVTDKITFECIAKFFSEFNKNPSKEIVKIELSNRTDITDDQLKSMNKTIDEFGEEDTNRDWLVKSTEKFCKDRAVYNAILDSIKIIDGKDKNRNQDAIPALLSQALGVTFDSHVGHDYLEDVEERYDFYHRVEEKIRFDIDLLNKITKGGLSKKTLNVALAGTGVGKSLFMCHMGASCLNDGKNVLYITMEMAEERIAERIDANLLNVTMDDLKALERDIFETKVDKVKAKTKGKLIIKEYPTAGAHAGHFRALLEELRLKKNFVPDIIFIDYLNICASQRLKQGANVNSYTYIKSIAEELRGLAVEHNVPIVSATQTTRSGFSNSDPGLEDTSESFGLPATVDFMFAMISTEELAELNQIVIKQLKNRYNDPNYYKRFVVGIDRAKMKLYDVEESAQTGMSDMGKVDDDKPLFDKSGFGSRMKNEKKDFSGFNF
jgi:replicative DNA helicase